MEHRLSNAGALSSSAIMNDEEIIKFVRDYTSVSRERLLNLLNCVENVIKNDIPGDLIEIGVWKGGLIMAMALKCKQMKSNRTIRAYDTFFGMTQLCELDGVPNNIITDDIRCYSSFEETKKNIDMCKYNYIVYHKGDITKTDLEEIPEKIAILRLDTDWYESTKFELKHFEPNVVKDGYIIVDDFGHWPGCKKAVEEWGVGKRYRFFQIDYTGIFWQKKLEFSEDLVEDIFEEIYDECGSRFVSGCGSYLFDGQSYKYDARLLDKQRSLYNAIRDNNVKTVLEIGVYMGHSLLLMLLANPKLRIIAVDISETYTYPACEVLRRYFPDAHIKFIKGNSKEVLKDLDGSFDLIHIDSEHSIEVAKQEYELCQNLSHASTIIVFDDYDNIRSYVNQIIKTAKDFYITDCMYRAALLYF
jgi:hypothetical protein